MHITIKKGMAPVSVELNLDLDLYCKLAKHLSDSPELRDQALPAEIADKFHLREPISPFLSYETAFQSVRQILKEQLSNLAGGIQWVEIENLLRIQCVECIQLTQDAYLHKLHEVLSLENKPLAIEAMQNYFIELLKNSIDAILGNYFLGKSETTALKMNIAIKVVADEKILINVSDNAGGFSKEYLTHFSQQLPAKKKLWNSVESKNKKYFFGGYGYGLAQLYDFVSPAGQRVGSVGKVMLLENSAEGAEITITTSLESYDSSCESQARKRITSPDLEEESGVRQLGLFTPVPCRKRPKMGNGEPSASGILPLQ